MNRNISAIACLALVLGCAAVQKESTQPAETPEISPSPTEASVAAKLDQITLRRNGWDGEFRSDGSATLQYVWRGSPVTPPENSAHAPAGSFSLEGIYKLLLPHLKRERDSGSTTVYLRVAGQPGANAMYLASEDIGTSLWYELRDKAVPYNEPHFQQLLSTYPFVPPAAETPELQQRDESFLR